MSTLAGLSKKANKKALPWGQSKDSGDKNAGNKMSFSLGSKASSTPAPTAKRNALFKSKSEKEKEDRKKSEEQATAEVFAEFVASFEETPTGQSKAFVRGNVINAETKDEAMRKGSVYKPSSRLSETLKEKTLASVGAGILGAYPGESQPKPKRPKEKEKSKKSNLEMFKEELKREQEERDQRHALKKTLQQEAVRVGATPPALQKIMAMEREMTGMGGSHDHGDPSTTNLYVGNLSPQMNEELLCLTFGKYGPLASVKIMWPRTDEEKARNRMCGFVAFMCREDGGQALDALNGKEVLGFELKMGWGKAVPIPPVPFYVAPELQASVAATMPPPPSGKPFNAQTRETVKPGARRTTGNQSGGRGQEDDSEDLRTLVIPVVIPHDRNLLCVIHRVIEFVIREGPMFEAMIMNKEINNPMFRFLFDNKEPAHIYYRWKLYSILQGERPDKWRLQEFSMFKSGSVWRPPPMPQLKTTLQAPTVEDPKAAVVVAMEKKGQLPEKDRDTLEEMLHKLNIDRECIAEGMLFCLDHADCAEEIVECITESLSILETPIPVKAARLYLVSDILYNCSAGVRHASHFRRGFESRLVEIFQHLAAAFLAISARIRADKFRHQVLTCIQAWEECAVYPPMFLVNLRVVFLGKEEQPSAPVNMDGAPLDVDGAAAAAAAAAAAMAAPVSSHLPDEGVDLDGMPLDLDGEPVGMEAETDATGYAGNAVEDSSMAADEDYEDDEDFTSRISSRPPPLPQKAKPANEAPRMLSKWETVDDAGDEDDDAGSASPNPNDIFSTGTASRAEPSSATSLAAISSARSPMTSGASSAFADVDSEEKRRRLREIEVKVVEYADRLEAKAKRRGRSVDIQAELEKYRQELLREYDSPSASESDDDGSHYNLVDNERERGAYGPHSTAAASSSSSSSRHHQSRRHSSQATTPHRSRSSSSSDSDSAAPSEPSDYSQRHQKSKRKRSHSPSQSSSRKHKRTKSPHRRKSPSSSSRHASKHRSRSKSRSRSPPPPQRSRSRSPTASSSSSSSSKRRSSKHKSSSSHHSSSGNSNSTSAGSSHDYHTAASSSSSSSSSRRKR